LRITRRRIAAAILVLGAIAVGGIGAALSLLWFDTDVGTTVLVFASVAAAAASLATALFVGLVLLSIRDIVDEQRASRTSMRLLADATIRAHEVEAGKRSLEMLEIIRQLAPDTPVTGTRLDEAIDDLDTKLQRSIASARLVRDGLPLVSVLMTTFESSGYVADAIASILDQSYPNLEIVVVDDASGDDTLSVVSSIAATDARVRVVACRRNRGTYWARNLGIMHARGDYVALHDSDDFSEPNRIELQVNALERRPRAVVSTCNYVRVNDHGDIVLNRGLRERRGFMNLMFDKNAVLDRAGFFDPVRKAADEEFFNRLRRVFGASAFTHIDQPLYRARVRGDSLTSGEVALAGDAGDDPLGHLSDERRSYFESFTAWHDAGGDLRMTFPLGARPFPAPEGFVPADGPRGCYVSASVATYPARRDSFRRVVKSILPQVDQLNVYLNNYDDIPSFLDDPRIRVATSQRHGDQRDNGKFFFVSDLPEGYHFTVDDDIHYPGDFVAYTIAKLRQYDDAVVIGYHGRILPEVVTRFFDETTTRVVSFRQELLADEPVHVLGTGALAYHTSAIGIEFADLRSAGMADVWFAALAQSQRVPLIAAARAQDFLRPADVSHTTSLYDEFAGRDDEQTRVAKQVEPWVFPSIEEALLRRR
jgi:glycosyltransferase involved in cell wall biosynthesis